MMARATNQRSSTLIDPATLQSRPASQHLNTVGPPDSQQTLGRRNSVNIKPLLNFDDDNKGTNATASRLPQGRSVFGVDTLWEREMIKLKEIEAQEKQEEEEAAEGNKKSKKKKSKRKVRSKSCIAPQLGSPSPNTPSKPKVSIEPPVLPDIPKTIRHPPPHLADDSSDSDRSDIDVNTAHNDLEWYAASSDEEDEGPRRTTGTGPRFPRKHHRRRAGDDDDDDDDVPLSHVHPRPHHLSPDSDDERPLSILVQKNQSSLLKIDFDNLGKRDEDDDNQPLGLRVSRLAPSLHHNSQAEDDDDKPLAFHPEQQRRSQLQMMAAQQQQFMMQAQLQNNIYFPQPPMMGTPFFGSTMMPMMMQAPIPIPSPPPMHDQAKYKRVDSWRHDVAVEGNSN